MFPKTFTGAKGDVRFDAGTAGIAAGAAAIAVSGASLKIGDAGIFAATHGEQTCFTTTKPSMTGDASAGGHTMTMTGAGELPPMTSGSASGGNMPSKPEGTMTTSSMSGGDMAVTPMSAEVSGTIPSMTGDVSTAGGSVVQAGAEAASTDIGGGVGGLGGGFDGVGGGDVRVPSLSGGHMDITPSTWVSGDGSGTSNVAVSPIRPLSAPYAKATGQSVVSTSSTASAGGIGVGGKVGGGLSGPSSSSHAVGPSRSPLKSTTPKGATVTTPRAKRLPGGLVSSFVAKIEHKVMTPNSASVAAEPAGFDVGAGVGGHDDDEGGGGGVGRRDGSDVSKVEVSEPNQIYRR